MDEINQCNFIKNDGTQCKNKVHGAYCDRHWLIPDTNIKGIDYTKNIQPIKLYVAPSKLPNGGSGLFTKYVIPKGHRIIEYIGEILNKKQFRKRYPKDDSQYVIEVDSNTYIDASNPKKSNVARYSNMCTNNNNCKNNAQYFTDEDSNKVYIWSTKQIPANTEIYTNYGDKYHLTK